MSRPRVIRCASRVGGGIVPAFASYDERQGGLIDAAESIALATGFATFLLLSLSSLLIPEATPATNFAIADIDPRGQRGLHAPKEEWTRAPRYGRSPALLYILFLEAAHYYTYCYYYYYYCYYS